jgi:hypothetical protein
MTVDMHAERSYINRARLNLSHDRHHATNDRPILCEPECAAKPSIQVDQSLDMQLPHNLLKRNFDELDWFQRLTATATIVRNAASLIE